MIKEQKLTKILKIFKDWVTQAKCNDIKYNCKGFHESRSLSNMGITALRKFIKIILLKLRTFLSSATASLLESVIPTVTGYKLTKID